MICIYLFIFGVMALGMNCNCRAKSRLAINFVFSLPGKHYYRNLNRSVFFILIHKMFSGRIPQAARRKINVIKKK